MYRPFLIADFKTGKSIGKEPWLSPQDAFPVLINWNVNKGVLEKRLGFSQLAQMKHGSTLQTATSITGIHSYVKDGLPNLLIMDSKGAAGNRTGRCNLYDPVDSSMTDISSDLTTPADIFTGAPSDYFHFLNARGVGYMVNNVDQIHKWTGRGSAVTPFNIKISDDTKANHINTCRFIFLKDDRIVLLETVEFGGWLSNRCRFSRVPTVATAAFDGDTDFLPANGGGFVDAPTQERICAAGVVGKNIAVYTQGPNSGTFWLIKSTGNSDIPLRWDKLSVTENCRSPYSGIPFKDGLISVGTSTILFYDGYNIALKDVNLPHLRDILKEFNDTFIRSVFAYNTQHNNIEERHLLFTFADSSSSVMDRILDYNVQENNFTVHKSNQSFFVNVIGGFNNQKVPAFIDLDAVVASDGALVSAITVDSRAVLGSPSPVTLIGGRNSRVYTWDTGNFDGTDDANGVIEIDAQSARFNPFAEFGRKVACEKIGYLVDNDANASFLSSVFKTTRSSAYTTKTISCDSDDDTVDKFWVWHFCDGQIGDFHRLKLSHTQRGNRPRIHAIMPYFQAAGRLDL